MKTIDYKDGKLITLSTYFDDRSKYLYLIYAIGFFCVGNSFLFRLLKSNLTYNITLYVFELIVIVACYLGTYRLVNKLLTTEQIFVNEKDLCLIKNSLLKTQKRVFSLVDLSEFQHVDAERPTPHPLAGQTFDYLGFEARQKVSSETYPDKRLSFIWKGRKISFGQNIYLWQFEDLKDIIYKTSGINICKPEKNTWATE